MFSFLSLSLFSFNKGHAEAVRENKHMFVQRVNYRVCARTETLETMQEKQNKRLNIGVDMDNTAGW